MNEIAKKNPPPNWDVLDAEKPLRMFSDEELRAAMGFSPNFSPVFIITSPPCVDFWRPVEKLIEGGK